MPNETLPERNRRVVLAARPVGAPKAEDFRLEEAPVEAPGPGRMLVRTLWLSLDPYMRGRMSDAKSYAAPVPIGGVMEGGTVGQVVASNLDGYRPGDLVEGRTGWQEYALSDGTGLRRLERDADAVPAQTALGVLGMPGMTAYCGLLEIGRPQPGETVVVAAAAGPVGSLVGQIAKIKGCRAVGIAGGEAKCRYVQEELGFDACLDHRQGADLAQRLQQACPDGIHVYFENVGGPVLDAVLPNLAQGARMPVCGTIAHYNDQGPPPGPDKLPAMMRLVLTRRLMLRGFIVSDFAPMQGEFLREVGAWVREGRVRWREDVAEGLDQAPDAFMRLLRGDTFGKALVRVAAAAAG